MLGGSVTVSASASDNSGIVTLVEFFVDGTLEASASAAPFAFAWDTLSVADGAHTLGAKAYDPSNNVGTSPLVAVTVKNQAGGGEVHQSPTAGAYTLPSVTLPAGERQTLGVQLRATTDGFLATAFRVDDVSLH
jgi:leucyl aminopeptidase